MVTFNPTQPGLLADALNLGGNSYQPVSVAYPSVALSGTGILSGQSGTVALSSTSLDFGDEAVGATTGSQIVSIENLGAVPFTIQSITTAGDFALTIFTSTTPLQVNPQASGAAYVNRQSRRHANRHPERNRSGGRWRLSQVYPATAVAFPNQPVGSVGGLTTVYLENVGTAAVTVDRVLVSGDFQIQDTSCPRLRCPDNCRTAPGLTPMLSASIFHTHGGWFASGNSHFYRQCLKQPANRDLVRDWNCRLRHSGTGPDSVGLQHSL